MGKKRKERRKLIICSNCGRKMVCMNKFDSTYALDGSFYVWYVCPRRYSGGEAGCGHSVLVKISQQTQRPSGNS